MTMILDGGGIGPTLRSLRLRSYQSGFRNCHLLFASLGSSSLSTVVLRVVCSGKAHASRRGSDMCPACSFCGGGSCACRELLEVLSGRAVTLGL